jgi:hypothetical protein
MQLIFIENQFKGLKKVLDFSMIENHPQKDVIIKRVKIIEFFKEFGKDATYKAYKVKKSTVYLWMQKLKSSGSLLSLAPKSRSPIKKREKNTPKVIEDFILHYRG